MILDFTQIHKADVLIAGGKGANLGEMTAAGINVPKRFVITADAYWEFLKENRIDEIISQALTQAHTDEHKLLAAAGEFRKRIIAGYFPVELEKEIRAKYAELGESARVAVRYRFNQGYDQSAVAIAVVIQEMVESVKAGVLFTFNPVTQNEDEMLINANYGIKMLDFENMSLAECSTFMEQSYELLQQLAYDRFKYALFPSFLMSKKFTKMIRRVNKNCSAFDFYWELNIRA